MHINYIPEGHKRLECTDKFTFACSKELPCFGSCCRKRDLLLTPYDVLRLKSALKLHSDDFLSQHTVYTLDPTTGFPSVSIKLEEADGKCPFLTPEGCSVYQDRPTVCRLFPLARVSGFKQESKEYEEFFYMLPTGSCLGIRRIKTQTIKEWIESQGVTPFKEANDKMLYLLFHPERSNDRALNEKQLQKIIVACYNLDVFREFIFNSNFFETFSVDAAIRSRIADNDPELLDLGMAYLRTTLFSSPFTI